MAFTSDKNPLMDKESVTEMLPADFTKGLAWWGKDATYGDPRGGVWTHGGFMQGVRTHLYFWPELNETTAGGMVILTNGEEDYSDVEAALEAVVRGAANTPAPRLHA